MSAVAIKKPYQNQVYLSIKHYNSRTVAAISGATGKILQADRNCVYLTAMCERKGKEWNGEEKKHSHQTMLLGEYTVGLGKNSLSTSRTVNSCSPSNIKLKT